MGFQSFAILRFLHVLIAVFMAAPLYLLIIANERGRLGPPLNYRVERYMENIIKKQPNRCYVYLAVLLLSGVMLMNVKGIGIGALLSNSFLAIKTGLVVVLFGLITYVHTQIQPRLEELISTIPEDGAVGKEVASEIGALRLKRKKIGTVCLFLVIATITFVVSLTTGLTSMTVAIILLLAALFSWRVYSSVIPLGLA